MDFKKKLKTRLNIAIIYFILGAILFACGFIPTLSNDYISTFGFALIVMAIVRIRNYFIITKNEETIRQQEIAETDERNISIINKAKSTTFSIYLFLSCMAVTILALLGIHDIAQYIAYSVLLFVVIYWSCYWIYQKKM